MKKVLVCFVVIMVVCGFAACGNHKVGQEAQGTVAEASFESGIQESGTYKNTFLGIGCTFDHTWVISSTEELAQLTGLAAQELGADYVKDALENGSAVFDLNASSSDGQLILNIVIEKLNSVSKSLDEKEYLNASKDSTCDMLEKSGFTDVVAEVGTTTFAGQTKDCLSTSGNVGSVPVYQRQICIKKGNYMATVTVNSVAADAVDSILNLFYAVEA